MPTRLAELEAKITQARKDYYNGSASVPDDVFDAWVDELAELDAQNAAVVAVGAPVGGSWPKVRHTIPMGSLDKVQTLDEMTAWVQKVSRSKTQVRKGYEDLVVTEKLDGISVSLRYERGKLVQALTRGDGVVGEDITPNVARMKGVLRQLPKPLTMFCRGEIVLLKEDHAKYFPETSNPRNTASGTSKRSDGQGCEHLTVLVYQALEVEEDLRYETEVFAFLESLGFQTPAYYLSGVAVGVKTPHDLWVSYQQTLRDALPYEIDGLVVRLNELSYQWSLGDRNGRPLGAVAFKFNPVSRETVAIGRIDQVGGTGRITPVAVFNPVRLLGAEVTRASLYNQKYIEQIGFDVGAKILVTRANDVIPRVALVTGSTGKVSPAPEKCPECGSSTEVDGEYVVCPNTGGCPAQTEGRLRQWVRELGILEWGPTLIQKVVSSGVRTVPDLYELTIEQVSSLERMGEASAKQAIAELWKVVPMPLEAFLGALSIPLCATSTIQAIVEAGYDDLPKIRSCDTATLRQIPGVGPKRAEALHTWLGDNATLLDRLLAVGVTIQPRAKGALTGQSVCFTGKSTMKRVDLEAMAKAAGASVKNSVGKGLTYLVSADPGSISSKAQAARKNGTTCISEEDFVRLCKGS